MMFLFPRQVIPYPGLNYPLGNVCQGLLPKGACPHWQVFFPPYIKRFFLLSARPAQCPAGRAEFDVSV